MSNQKENPRFTEIKTAMLVHVPFFSSLLFDIMDVKIGKFPEIFQGRTPTAATDGKKIYIDEDFLKGLKLPEAVFLVCHEIAHAMWMHMSRADHYLQMGFEGEKFDPRRWNYAGDYVINDMLVQSKIGDMPKCGLLDPKYKAHMSCDEVYRDLKDKMPPAPPQITITFGPCAGDQQADNEGGMDVHIHAPMDMNEAEVKRAIQTAVNAAKAQDKMPAALERWATEFLKPQVSWKDQLRYAMSRAIGYDHTTWVRPNRRRLVGQGIYLPANIGHGSGKVVVVVDTSGSIGEKELNTFLSEVDDICMTTQPESVYLIGCDSAIGNKFMLQAGESLVGQEINLGGGGGTSFIPPFEMLEEEGYVPSVLVYLTDMEGPFPPASQAPSYPVIWCRTTRKSAPFGEHIDISFD